MVVLALSVLQGAQAVDYLFWDGPTCSGLVLHLNQQRKLLRLGPTLSIVAGPSDGPTYTAASWQSRCINGTPIVEAPIPAANVTLNRTSNATTNVTIPGALLSELRSPSVLAGLDCTCHVDVDDSVIYYREDPTKFVWSLRVNKEDKLRCCSNLQPCPSRGKPSGCSLMVLRTTWRRQ
ncbi:hypothetical protein AXG93_360s1000 [Marchantia polymorpha subsp. ruderalis]|uniref:Uncharacterized protein n=1 Tax=Marchantia polymorpha subsp. ruderalis TaxID=1480154 RepID=A0A176VP15_MARPO|nr:hypothetical protein AXG93_360s1000 [Marchantia polymorpha subsp. ruderalis]